VFRDSDFFSCKVLTKFYVADVLKLSSFSHSASLLQDSRLQIDFIGFRSCLFISELIDSDFLPLIDMMQYKTSKMSSNSLIGLKTLFLSDNEPYSEATISIKSEIKTITMRI